MWLIKWDSLLPSKDIFGEDMPTLDSVGWDLATDIYKTDDGLVVEMQAPGIQADAYDIKVEDGVLTVSGKREKDIETKDQDYYRKEIQRGSFERRVKLPDEELDEVNLRPALEGGVLKILIPKKA